jgi:hypothetical protein
VDLIRNGTLILRKFFLTDIPQHCQSDTTKTFVVVLLPGLVSSERHFLAPDSLKLFKTVEKFVINYDKVKIIADAVLSN